MLLQPRGKSPHLCVLFFFYSHVPYEAVPPLVCLLLVRNDICFVLLWVRVTHIVVASCFGLGSPPWVLTGAKVCYSWIHRMLLWDSWTYHGMIFPLFHAQFHHNSNDTEQGNINERFLSERPWTMCMCIHVRVCLCVRRLRFHWLRTDLPLRKSSWFPAKVK